MTPDQLFADTTWLRQVARTLVNDPEAADDLVQEAWLARLRNPDSEVRSPRAWMRRVLFNRLAKLRRGNSRRLAREQAAARAEALPSTEDLCMRAELQRILGQELLNLEEPLRTTMLLRFLEGITPAEIAARQGELVNTVRWRLRKGQECLRKRLGEELGNERDWRLALLPFALPAGDRLATASTSIGALHVLGGLLMLKKTLVVCFIVLGIALGWRELRPSIGEPAIVENSEVNAPATLISAPTATPEADSAVVTERVPASQGNSNLTSRAARATATIEFHAFAKETGLPLEGVVANLESNGQALFDSETIRSRPTDAQGVTRFEVPANASIHVQAWGVKPSAGLAIADVPPLAPGAVEIVRLEHPTSIDLAYYGRLVDAEGLPLEARLVRAQHPAQLDGCTDEALSDSNGVFELRFPSWRFTWFTIDAQNQGRIAFLPVAGFGSSLEPQELKLPGTGEIEGQVQLGDFASGAISIHGTARPQDITRPVGSLRQVYRHAGWSAAVDAFGRYRLSGINAGAEISLRLEVDGQVVLESGIPALLQAGEVQVVDWNMDSTSDLRGMLADQDGEPVGNAELWLVKDPYSRARRLTEFDRSSVRSSVKSDGAGSFHFTGIEAGSYVVGPAPEANGVNKGLSPTGTPVSIDSEGLHPDLLLTTWRGYELRGSVLLPDGAPASSVRIELVASDRNHLRITSDEFGHFVARGLRDQSYTLSAGGNDRGYARSEPVTAHPRDGEELEIHLASGGAVHGRLRDGGAAVTSGKILISENGHHNGEDGWINVDVRIDGSFRVDGLNPGIYDFYFGREDGHYAGLFGVRVPAGPATEEHHLAMAQGGWLTLTKESKETWLGFEVFHQGAFLDFGSLNSKWPSRTLTVPAGVIEIRSENSKGRLHSVLIDVGVGRSAEAVLGSDEE